MSVCDVSCLYSCVFQACNIQLENHNDGMFYNFYHESALPQLLLHCGRAQRADRMRSDHSDVIILPLLVSVLGDYFCCMCLC